MNVWNKIYDVVNTQRIILYTFGIFSGGVKLFDLKIMIN